jgi:cold-inducible RNA-binding protein
MTLNKLYVDNLAAATTDRDLMDLFSAHGNVTKISLPMSSDRRPRGFGFVTMATPEGARAAIRALHGKQIGTRRITVSESWPGEEHTQKSSGSDRHPG